MTNPWHFIDKYAGECTAEVTRQGISQPCDKTAYAVVNDEEGYWPVCVYHARGRRLVPLVEVLDHFARCS